MKPKSQNRLLQSKLILAMSIAAPLFALSASAAEFTWDGSEDEYWSTGTNWVGDAAPAATGSTLVFAGATGLSNTNDTAVTSLVNGSTHDFGSGAVNVGAITFAPGAGSFTLGGSTINWETNGNGRFVYNLSGVNQTLDMGFGDTTGNNNDRAINAGGATLTFNGNISFGNDRLFPEGTAGTIVLNGANSGDGTGNALVGGTNVFRSTVRNNVANTQLVLGSETAVGNHNVDYANRRGVVANQNLYLSSNTDLTGEDAVLSTFVINNSWIDFNSSNNLEIGGLIVQSGNRDFKLTGSGNLIISSHGIDLSSDQTARQLYLNQTGSGTLTVNGTIHDTFHSGGVTTTVNDIAGKPTKSIFRKAGTGTMTLNGDSGSTFHGDFRIEANGGKVVLGHENALGPATSTTLAASTTADVFLDSEWIDVPDTTGIVAGQTVTGAGIPEGTTVLSVDAINFQVELSALATADGEGVTLDFSSSMTHLVTLGNGGTLDLNGHALNKTFHAIDGSGVGGNGAIVNSNTSTAAEITTDLTNFGDFTVGGDGDLTLYRVNRNAIRTVTKVGNGTLTLAGTAHNNLYQWTVNAGTVMLAKTVGGQNAIDRALTINGGTVREGAGGHQIGNGVDVAINGGTLDLNGRNDAIGGLNAASPGGTVLNNDAGPATLYVGGSSGGTASGSYAGAIQDGTGVLNLTKEGSGTQTLTGTLAYSGDTTVSAGILSLSSASLDDDSAVVVDFAGNSAVLNLTHSDTDVVASLDLGSGPLPEDIYNAGNTGGAITGSGSIQVIFPAAGGYTTWATDNGATGQTPDQDHDLDGVPNGAEYFMGETGSTFTANPALDGTNTVTWPKDAAYSGTYEVQISTDLVDWTDDTANATDNGTSVVYQLTGSGKQFVRLVVTPN